MRGPIGILRDANSVFAIQLRSFRIIAEGKNKDDHILQARLAEIDNRSLNYFNKFTKGDALLGIIGSDRIRRIGLVESIHWEARNVLLVVQWTPYFAGIRTTKDFFDSEHIVQAITSSMVYSLTEMLRDRYPDDYETQRTNEVYTSEKVFEVQEFVSGSENEVSEEAEVEGDYETEDFEEDNNMDVDEDFEEIQEDEDDNTGGDGSTYIDKHDSIKLGFVKNDNKNVSPKEDPGGKITLFFGTNRNKTNSNDENLHFGDELSDNITYGRCIVNIPHGHDQGKMERPWQIPLIGELSENEKKHIMLQHIDEYVEGQFLADLKKDVEELKDKVGLLFLHGYNTTFAEAARRTGQIAWDIPFHGIAGFFSWASCGETLDYLTDIERADSSINQLKHFIQEDLLATGLEKLHIIAHSMGNRLFTFTMKEMSGSVGLEQKLSIIRQIVLAAPDIDQKVFTNTILPHFKTVGVRRTLYTSDRDTTMKLSKKLRGNQPRLGNAGDFLFIDDSLDTVDTSNINPPGILKHGYIFDTKELLTDLNFLFGSEIEPEKRQLRKRETKKKLIYWLFPE